MVYLQTIIIPNYVFMKNRLIAFTFIVSTVFASYAQNSSKNDSTPEKKYQNLLWKISGNGLENPSYLYGTMHVSKKVAFHLDDVFYQALNDVDAVAVESTPDTWIEYLYDSTELNSILGQFSSYSQGFYKEGFKMKSPDLMKVSQFLSHQDQILNGLLFRSNKQQQDFEEDTYLDMFIYQTGRKFDKETISLESVKESNYLVSRASIQSIKTKPSVWLQKKLEEKTYYDLLEDSYRKRDLDVIDSINNGGNTKHHNKYMLWIRNDNMMRRLDSVIQKGKTVFAGIGAAHLPGDRGAIEILRNMGYTVIEHKSAKTSIAENYKAKFENTFNKKPYKTQQTPDGFISLKAPMQLTELNIMENRIHMSPDLANGAFVILSRINTYDLIDTKETITYNDIKGILFESIPGKIEKETEITIGGYKAVDILNKTKNGNYQRYNIILTPLEIIVIKMGGKKDFVLKYGDEVFDSIQIKNTDNKKVVVAPYNKEFELQVPDFYTFDNKKKQGKRSIQAIDKNTKSYYFFTQQVLNDIEYLEEDQFELTQIQRRFYEEYDLDVPEGKYSASPKPVYKSKQVFDKEKQDTLYLKTTVQAGKYYLLGMLGKNEKEANSYFNSFKTKVPKYYKKFEMMKDTSMYFSTKSIVEPPPIFGYYFDSYEKKEKDKDYKEFSRENTYVTKANEAINVSMHKFNHYESYENIDSLWSSTEDYYLGTKAFRKIKRAGFVNFKLKEKTIGKDKNGLPMMQLKLVDSTTNRMVWMKKIIKNGSKYTIRTLMDTINPPSEFVTNFFESFTPTDSILGRDLFEDKVPMFIKALKENDSLVFDTYRMLALKKKHIPELKDLISNFNFPKDKQEIRTHLIQEMGSINDTEITKYLDKLYKDSYDNSYAQHAVLYAYALRKEKSFNKRIARLLEKDIPLTTSGNAVSYLFSSISDSLELAKDFYPEMLNYTTINEYKTPIYDLLTMLKDSAIIGKKHYKNFRKQILTEAKIALKRKLSDKYTKDENSYYSSYDGEDLANYISLLYPYKDKPSTKDFFTKLKEVEDKDIMTKLITLQLLNKDPYSRKAMDSVAADLESRIGLYRILERINEESKFPSKYANQKSLAESILFGNEYTYDKKTDTLIFIEKRSVKINKDDISIYLFKTKKIKQQTSYDRDRWNMHVIAFEKKEDKQLVSSAYFQETDIEIKETETLEEQVDVAVQRVLWKDRKRVSFDTGYNQYY